MSFQVGGLLGFTINLFPFFLFLLLNKLPSCPQRNCLPSLHHPHPQSCFLFLDVVYPVIWGFVQILSENFGARGTKVDIGKGPVVFCMHIQAFSRPLCARSCNLDPTRLWEADLITFLPLPKSYTVSLLCKCFSNCLIPKWHVGRIFVPSCYSAFFMAELVLTLKYFSVGLIERFFWNSKPLPLLIFSPPS